MPEKTREKKGRSDISVGVSYTEPCCACGRPAKPGELCKACQGRWDSRWARSPRGAKP